MPLIMVSLSVSEVHEWVFIVWYAMHINEEWGDYMLGHTKGKIWKKISVSNMMLMSSLLI